MGSRLVIEDNTIYEIDEECLKKMEEKKRREQIQKTKNSKQSYVSEKRR